MNNHLKYMALASALALVAMTIPGDAAKRASQGQECIDNQTCADGVQSTDNQRKMRRPDTDNQKQQKAKRRDQAGDENQMKRKTKRAEKFDDNDKKKRRVDTGWRYDSNKHRRNRNRTTIYRYYYGGYWYPQPYWTGQVVYVIDDNYGISCRQGRNIVDQRFSRVQTVECNGSSFTYVGRRNGDTYRVRVSSRSGNIISVRPI